MQSIPNDFECDFFKLWFFTLQTLLIIFSNSRIPAKFVRWFVYLLAFYLMHIAHMCLMFKCWRTTVHVHSCMCSVRSTLVFSKMVIFTLISLIETKRERSTMPGYSLARIFGRSHTYMLFRLSLRG